MAKKRIGDLLIEAELINSSQLENALILQKENKHLGKILIELGYVTEEQITQMLSKQTSIPLVDVDKYDVPDAVLALVPKEFAEARIALPLELENKRLTVAMAYPGDWRTVDDLSFVTGRKIKIVMATESSIKNAIGKYYTSPDQILDLIKELPVEEDVEFYKGTTAEKVDEEKFQTAEFLSDAPLIVKLVTMIMVDAARSRASDIHIEPSEYYVQVRYRIDGELKNILRYPLNIEESVSSRIKIISDLDITNRRLPQDGRTQLKLEGKIIDFRVSTLPSVYGEKIVLRLLDHTVGLVPLSQLGMPEKTLKTLLTQISKPQGMILITGPTGSGKTTTLYGLLHQVQSETKNMVTIEDPVEYHVFGTTQVGINESIGLTFSSVLRNVLRQDPDVIMVGEIRDRDTADIATRAALTGHFVLSTLHTNNTVATITRLLDIGLEPYLVVAAVTGIMAQRLVRRICKNCIAPVDPPDIIDDLKFAKINNFFRGRGCSECKYTGYKGRIGVYEMLMLNLELKKKIIQGVSEEDLLAAAREFGFETMFEDACAKVDAGYTTFEEILTKVPYEYVT